MNQQDFLKLIGAGPSTDYLPVAGILKSGAAFAGFYNSGLNNGLSETLVLLNMRIVDLRGPGGTKHDVTIESFYEFVEEIVNDLYEGKDPQACTRDSIYGKSVPLTGMDLDQIGIVYPVAHISSLMKSAEKETSKVPTFLDFDNKSSVIKLLRTKLW